MNLHSFMWPLVVATGLWASGCRPHNPPPLAAVPLPTAPVRTIKVETRTRPVTEEVMGTVRARVRAGLEAKLSGRIEELRVVAGQTVQEGEVIARLDARESQARLDQALALREQAANELKRKSTLLEAKAITQSEYDGALASFRVTEAVVKEAETQRGHTIITAPFSGVITRKLAEAGDQAIPGRTLV